MLNMSSLRGGCCSIRCRFTSLTPRRSRSTSAAGILSSLSLSLGMSPTATATENASHRSTSANGSAYPSAMTTGTHSAWIASTTRGLATSCPLGHRQKRARRMNE
ncbi:Os04g0110000 [Oryza sativa Japonica Group]|uniref:Os04g0110000 protein n=1 Tax=Oryza sativa subsp. japonica TaxID=39947 RepID=A0A0P0W6H6_ORYSJ|nr:Os04g0110000 [Oryza sativa Japonica Group]